MRITPQEVQARLAATRPEADCLQSKMGEHLEGEVLVKLPDTADVAELGQDYGLQVLETIKFSGEMQKSFNGKLVHARLPEGISTAQGIALLEKDPRVIYADANDVVERQATPDDLHPQLWGLKKIEAEAAWDTVKGSRNGPIVAVIDSGIDQDHPDLVANLWTNPRESADGRDNDGNDIVDDLHGYNAINGSGNPEDDNSHGTHCAGTIAGVGNNGQGVVGVNWEGQILAGKFLSDKGKGAISNAVKVVGYASAQGARIQSHSWGHTGSWGNRALEDAMRSSPSLHICAAGNDAKDVDAEPHYPSSFGLDNIVSVAASDWSDQLASFSNYGTVGVDLAAPGVGIYSTTPGSYGSMSGTSMATPHVSGVAALIATAQPNASNDQIKRRLMASVDVVDSLAGTSQTGGRLNARKAVETDNVAPGALGSFRVSARATGEMQLGWIATGDDGTVGRASSYQLRSSPNPIDEGNFESLPIMRTGMPAEAGQAETRPSLAFPETGDRTMHFAMRAVDNVGNRSPLARTSVVIPGTRVAFDDNMDGFSNRWSGEGWGRVSIEGRGKVWTDSPSGDYEHGANRALTSPSISLAGVTGAAVTFDYKHDLENRFDKVALEVSSDGQSWTGLQEFTGKKMWERARVDLSAYDGQSIQLRFRLTTDNAVAKDGFYLDRVVVAGSQK